VTLNEYRSTQWDPSVHGLWPEVLKEWSLVVGPEHPKGTTRVAMRLSSGSPGPKPAIRLVTQSAAQRVAEPKAAPAEPCGKPRVATTPWAPSVAASAATGSGTQQTAVPKPGTADSRASGDGAGGLPTPSSQPVVHAPASSAPAQGSAGAAANPKKAPEVRPSIQCLGCSGVIDAQLKACPFCGYLYVHKDVFLNPLAREFALARVGQAFSAADIMGRAQMLMDQRSKTSVPVPKGGWSKYDETAILHYEKAANTKTEAAAFSFEASFATYLAVDEPYGLDIATGAALPAVLRYMAVGAPEVATLLLSDPGGEGVPLPPPPDAEEHAGESEAGGRAEDH